MFMSGEKKVIVVGYEKKLILEGKICFNINVIIIGILFVLICFDEIYENLMLIQNWNCIILWMIQICYILVMIYFVLVLVVVKSEEIIMWDILSMGI